MTPMRRIPYGVMTFEDDFSLQIPNLTIRNMLVEVYGNIGYRRFPVTD